MGAEPPQIWAHHFHRSTDRVIADVLELCINHYPKHPPSLGEFNQLIQQATPKATAPQLSAPETSIYTRGGNKVLLRISMEEGGLGDLISGMTEEKNRVVEQFEVMAKEDDIEWQNFIETIDSRLRSKLKELRKLPE